MTIDLYGVSIFNAQSFKLFQNTIFFHKVLEEHKSFFGFKICITEHLFNTWAFDQEFSFSPTDTVNGSSGLS